MLEPEIVAYKIYISRRLQVGTRWKHTSPYAGPASTFSAEFRDAMPQDLTSSGSMTGVDFNEGMQGPKIAVFFRKHRRRGHQWRTNDTQPASTGANPHRATIRTKGSGHMVLLPVGIIEDSEVDWEPRDRGALRVCKNYSIRRRAPLSQCIPSECLHPRSWLYRQLVM